jgi:hypothetical protein
MKFGTSKRVVSQASRAFKKNAIMCGIAGDALLNHVIIVHWSGYSLFDPHE